MIHAIFQWGWTGFTGKTLWDWLQLLIIPVLLFAAGAWFTRKQAQESDAENKDNQRETALQSYIDNLSELLLHEKLKRIVVKNIELDEVQKIAQVRTLTVLPRLDGVRKRYVLQFLYDAGLIQTQSGPVVHLRGANFSGIKLTGVNFKGADLSETNLSQTDLRGADLREANLSETDLSGAQLRGANLSNAKLTGAIFLKADLSGFKYSRFRSRVLNLLLPRKSDDLIDDVSSMFLGFYGTEIANKIKKGIKGANLSGADLSGAFLYKANFSRATLKGATLAETDLKHTDLSSADLSDAILVNADLRGANLREATANGANFNGTKLQGADLSETEGVDLLNANVKGAITPEKSLNYLLRREIYDKNRAAQKNDLNAFASRLTLLHTLKGHHDIVNSIVLSQNTRIIVSGSADKTIKIWNTRDGLLLRTLALTEAVKGVVLSQDGYTIISSENSETEAIKTWRTLDSMLLCTCKENREVTSIAIGQDSHIIVSGGLKMVKIWNALDGTLQHTLQHIVATDEDIWQVVGYVWSVALSQDGHIVASGGFDEIIKVWNALDGTLLNTLKGNQGAVTSVALSQDGHILVSGSTNGTINIWNTFNGALQRTLKGHGSSVRSVALSQDSRTIVSGSEDKTVKVWNALNGTLLRTLKGHSSWVVSVAISQDGCIIVSGSHDKTIKVWGMRQYGSNTTPSRSRIRRL